MYRILFPLVATAYLISTGPAAALCVCVKCLSGNFRHFIMPASSMEPTLPAGSCFTMKRARYSTETPARGKVISYVSPATRETYIARLIGLPGDQVQMLAGKLWLNSEEVPQTAIADFVTASPDPRDPSRRCGRIEDGHCITSRSVETLPGGPSYEVLNLRDTCCLPDFTDLFTVPEGHVFVLGDNRDNAMDSRFERLDGLSGMVPVKNITGTFDSILSP